MKDFIIAVVILVLAVLSFAAYRTTYTSNPMIGTWKMVSGVYYAPGGETDFSTNTREMKVINETHFTTLWQDTLDINRNTGFNGGVYTFKDGIYTEYLEYFTIEDRVGDTAYFKVEFENELLNISACDAEGNISKTGYFQVWKRVE